MAVLSPSLRRCHRLRAAAALACIAAFAAALPTGNAAAQAPGASALWAQPRPLDRPPAHGLHLGGETRMGIAWSSTQGFRFVSSAEITIDFTARTPGGLRIGASVPIPAHAWQPDLLPGR